MRLSTCLRSGAVPRQWSPLAPFCARRAAFFWRRSALCVWRCLAWIFLRRESDIFGMGVILGSRHRSKMDRDDRGGKQEAFSLGGARLRFGRVVEFAQMAEEL